MIKKKLQNKGEADMAIQVDVPKDLSSIKQKVVFNLTGRQLLSFGLAGMVGIPVYLFTKDILGSDISALGMVAVMLPFFFLALYEKEGFPAEKLLYFWIRRKFLSSGLRLYKANNIFHQLEEIEAIREEIAYLEEKAKGKHYAKTYEKRTKSSA